MHVDDLIKSRAEELCARINDRIGWNGANPEFVDRRYTGRVVVSDRAAAEIGRLLEDRVANAGPTC